MGHYLNFIDKDTKAFGIGTCVGRGDKAKAALPHTGNSSAAAIAMTTAAGPSMVDVAEILRHRRTQQRKEVSLSAGRYSARRSMSPNGGGPPRPQKHREANEVQRGACQSRHPSVGRWVFLYFRRGKRLSVALGGASGSTSSPLGLALGRLFGLSLSNDLIPLHEAAVHPDEEQEPYRQ